MNKAIALTVLTLWTLAAAAAEVRIPLPDREDLLLNLPAQWQHQVNRPEPNMPPTIVIGTEDRQAFVLLLTPIWGPGTANRPATDAQLRSLVELSASDAKAKAVEKKLPVTKIGGTAMPGYYFSATDREPEPGGYKHLSQGAVGVKELRVTFTFLANGDPKKLQEQVLQLMRGLKRVPKKGAGKEATKDGN
jgi:hypothetical protein